MRQGHLHAGLLVAAVLGAHALALHWLGHQLVVLDTRPDRAMPRLQAAYVRELRPVQPPAARPSPPTRPRAPARPRPVPVVAPAAASAPAAELPASEPPPPELAQAASAVAIPVAEAASAPADPASTATEPTAPAVAAAASEPLEPADHFAWPASTRIRYVLTGQFRGDIHGSAEVQWLRQGERYQVHLEAVIGPKMAPLGSRRMSSEGRTTAQGLQPDRYEQETRMLLSEPRLLRMAFDAQFITLANGTRVARQPDMEATQDTASQFVQLVWLFRSQPERLAVGQRVEFTLAFPRRVLRWTYDVVDRTHVITSAGAVEAFHVKPPRDATGGDWTTEMWFAPTLQYLPVRLLIRQDAQTYVDLAMEGLPEQAER